MKHLYPGTMETDSSLALAFIQPEFLNSPIMQSDSSPTKSDTDHNSFPSEASDYSSESESEKGQNKISLSLGKRKRTKPVKYTANKNTDFLSPPSKTPKTDADRSSLPSDSSGSSDSESESLAKRDVSPLPLGKRKRSQPVKFSGDVTPKNRKRIPTRSSTGAGKQNSSKKEKIEIPKKVLKRGTRCGKCAGCLRDDCGKCSYCLDKPKFGGPGKKKQRCVLRTCSNFEHRRGSTYYLKKLNMDLETQKVSGLVPDVKLVSCLCDVTSCRSQIPR